MSAHTAIPFWLKVRKEYIYDNFEAMTDYLRRYDYNPDSPAAADYDDTLACLMQIADEIADACDAGTDINVDRRLDANMCMRLLGVTLLASHKRGNTPHRVLRTLLNCAIRADIYIDDELARQLWRVAAACIRQCQVARYVFSWDTLADPAQFHVSLFVRQLAATDFGHTETAGVIYNLENHGLLSLGAGSIVRILPMNAARALTTRCRTLAAVPAMFSIDIPADDVKRADTFDALLTEARFILKALPQITPSPVVRKKDYTHEDIFVVRITSRYGIKAIAETVDPRYNRLSGKILTTWGTPYRPEQIVLRDMLQEGDYVFACLSDSEDFTFEMGPALDDTYDRLVRESANCTDDAMFSNDTPDGSMWVTSAGVRILIHRSKTDALSTDETEILDDARHRKIACPIQFYAQAPDTGKPAYKVYASPQIDIYAEAPERFSIADADRDFYRIFIEDATAEGTQYGEYVDAKVMTTDDARTLTHIISRLARQEGLNATDRLIYLLAATVAATVAGLDSHARLLTFSIDYLERLVAFSHGNELRPITDIPADIAGDPTVTEALNILTTLTSYRTTASDRHTCADCTTTQTRLKTLVNASNSLRGIIGDAELGNIKLAITRLLGTDDEYTPDGSDRTNYGNESVSLEFKTSIVFPPTNRRRPDGAIADPDLQKWAILKPICGMLNSRTGGDLLIGVNDNGYPSGIDNDINELYRLKRITSADADHYRQYIQYMLDRAFKEHGAPTQSSDIVALNVNILIEGNTERRPIIRIQVRPYPYGVVMFADDSTRPMTYADAYVRRDGRTIPVTPKLLDEISRYKLDDTADHARNIILLSKACSNRQIVNLLQYQSGTGTHDRRVEVYKVWKKQGLIYGYDLDRQAPRLFKVQRTGTVQVTDRTWTTPHCTLDTDIDHFGMILDHSRAYTVVILLSEYGRLLLEEQVPSVQLTPNRHDPSYPWRYETRVSTPEGIGRFCLSLPGHHRIIQGAPVQTYIIQSAHTLADI